ncbi:reverse transcriptase domain-containing protein [Tanacetum coccineum]
MKVNINDIVIKSNVEEEMLADIKETLDGLRVINLKLNPKKCSFGVEEGIFSRQLITKQGIKESPSKVKAISDLQPPKSVNEIQNLNRKLAALNRFLSKGADKTLPFMRTLKSCTSGKMVQWTTEADEAFRRMKELLEALPTGAELEYPELEKLIPALVYAAKKLRRYFQAHPIQVLSDKPIKQILARPKKLGHIAKWAIELGEHEIKFRGRNSVNGQILADFLAETPSKEEEGAKNEEAKRKELEPEKAWKLFTDGASSSDGSGSGLILVSLKGKEYTYALRFEFKTIKNEAEYEALLAGLRIAKEMKVQELTILVDSHVPCSLPKTQNTLIPYISLSPQANGQAHRTTLKSSNGETPLSLVYGSVAVIPIKISIETRRIQDFNPKQNEKRRKEDLNILEERREIASIKEAHYKQKLEGYYNKHVRLSTFKPGTYVLRINSASKAEFQGKIGPTWEWPYIVKKAYGDGGYKLETLSGSPINRTWNESNLRKFYI